MTTDVAELAKKIDRLLAKSNGVEPHIFDEGEVKDLLRVLAFTRRIEAVGWFGKYLFLLIVAIGTLLANWDRMMEIFKQ